MDAFDGITEFDIGYEEQSILETGGEIVIKNPWAIVLDPGDRVTLRIGNLRSVTSRRRFPSKITAIVVERTDDRIILSLKGK